MRDDEVLHGALAETIALHERQRAADPRPVLDAAQAIVAALGGGGRLVIRKSGTEPLIRVMAEGDDARQVERVVDSICDAVREAV